MAGVIKNAKGENAAKFIYRVVIGQVVLKERDKCIKNLLR
jgi:hypothetical protein